MAIQIKEGAYYEDGNGDFGGPASFDDDTDEIYCWVLPFQKGHRRYMADGRYDERYARPLDLVREVPAPAPEAPKPETVTVTQEMVDRKILSFAYDLYESDIALTLAQAWATVCKHVIGEPEQDTPQTDDGWTPWEGGECPVDVDTLVAVKFRRGGKAVAGSAGAFGWSHSFGADNIVAYRIVNTAS